MDRRTTVAIVAHNVHAGGGMETQLRELIRGLSRYYQLVIITTDNPMEELPYSRWVKIRSIQRPLLIKLLWFALVGSWAVLRLRPDIVVSTGAILFTKVDIDVVHYVHRSVARRGNPRRKNPNKFLRVNALLVEKVSIVMERICYSSGKTKYLVAVADGVVKDLQRDFGSRLAPVITIPNGIDFERYTCKQDSERLRIEWGIDPHSLIILFVGGNWVGKGLPVLLSGINLLEPELQNNIQVVVVGKGSPQDMTQWTKDLRAHVIFTGPQEDVAAWYQAADIFALPSYHETFGLVVFEAAAAGLPIICTKVGEVERVILHEHSGILVEPKVDMVANALRLLANDPKLRYRLGVEARNRAKNFGWPAVIEQYAKLIQFLATKSSVTKDLNPRRSSSR